MPRIQPRTARPLTAQTARAKIEDAVADGRLTKTEKTELNAAAQTDGTDADTLDKVKAFLGMKNASVRNFVVAASADGKIDKREATSLMDMMIASKGVSKREKRSVAAAMQFVRFTDGAQEVVGALELPAVQHKAKTLAELPVGFKATIPLRDAGTNSDHDFNTATVIKGEDGQLRMTLDFVPDHIFDHDEHTVVIGDDGKGRFRRENVGIGDSRFLARPRQTKDYEIRAELSLDDGQLVAKAGYSYGLDFGQGGAASGGARYVGRQDDSFDARNDISAVSDRKYYARDVAKLQITDGQVFVDGDGIAQALKIEKGGQFTRTVKRSGANTTIDGQLSADGKLEYKISVESFVGRDRRSIPSTSGRTGYVDDAMMQRVRSLLFSTEG